MYAPLNSFYVYRFSFEAWDNVYFSRLEILCHTWKDTRCRRSEYAAERAQSNMRQTVPCQCSLHLDRGNGIWDAMDELYIYPKLDDGRADVCIA